MLKRLIIFISIFLVISAAGTGYASEPAINPDQIEMAGSGGSTQTFHRQYYMFCSLIHHSLPHEPMFVNFNEVMLPFEKGADFAVMINIAHVDNKTAETIEDFAKKEIHKEWNTVVGNTYEMNTFTQISAEQLVRSNASKGYWVFGYNETRKPMKVKMVDGFLESPDHQRFLKVSGILAVNPVHPVYINNAEIDKIMDYFKMAIVTARFE